MNGQHHKTCLTFWIRNSTSIWIRAQMLTITSVKSGSAKKMTVCQCHGGGYTVFCNPPYSQIARWVEKAFDEGHKDNTTVVLLIPARTDTRYFHNFIYGRSEIRFIRGRLKFGEAVNSAPFPSMVVIFRGAERKRKND